MFSVYCGSEDFAREISGYDMEIAIRDALQERDPMLAKSLQADAEAGGLELAASSESDLRRALEVAAAAGLLKARTVDDLERDDIEHSGSLADANAAGGDELVFPVSAYKVSGSRLIGSFASPAFATGPEREMSVDELARRARRILETAPGLEDVAIGTDDWRVTINAPDLDTLRAACIAVGTVGLSEDAGTLFGMLRDADQQPHADHDLSTGPTLQTPNGPWEARTPWSDAPFSEEGDTVKRLRRLYAFIEQADSDRGRRVDLDRDDDTLLVIGEERSDVEWVVGRLSAR